MCTLKRKYTRRISVWALVFAVVFCMWSASCLLPVSATTPIDGAMDAARHTADGVGDVVRGVGEVAGDAVQGVGDAAGDAVRGAGKAAGNAVDDVMDMTVSEGRVRDRDGVIGNELRAGRSGDTDNGARAGGWLGWAIAVVIALIVVAMIIILIPKKKTD